MVPAEFSEVNGYVKRIEDSEDSEFKQLSTVCDICNHAVNFTLTVMPWLEGRLGLPKSGEIGGKAYNIHSESNMTVEYSADFCDNVNHTQNDRNVTSASVTAVIW